MVKNIVLFLLLLLASWSVPVTAESRITVRTDKNTVTLGEAVMLEIRVEEAGVSLSQISLDKLKQQFNLFSIASSTQSRMKKGRKVATETMTLTLYPLRSGKLSVPSFSYMGKSSNTLQLSVLESGAQTPRVHFKTALDVTRAQVRQAATLTLEIYDDGSLQWNSPRELEATGAHQRRLSDTQREEMLDGIRYTVHRFSWALMPLREGGLKIEFPMLDAFKFGTRLRYAVAPLWIDAAAVPAYLPVHVPIGKPVMEVAPLPLDIALDRPFNWHFTVQGAGISAEGLSKLFSSVHGDAMLKFYPVRVTATDPPQTSNASQSFQITLPFVALRAGTLQLPEINLPYYDPSNSRVDAIVIGGQHIEVINPLWHQLVVVAMALFALLALGGFAYWGITVWRGMLKKRHAIQRIRGAANAAELKRALLNFSSATLGQCLTLRQWLQQMQGTSAADGRLAELVEKVEQAQYGAHAGDNAVAELAGEAVLLLGKCGAIS